MLYMKRFLICVRNLAESGESGKMKKNAIPTTTVKRSKKRKNYLPAIEQSVRIFAHAGSDDVGYAPTENQPEAARGKPDPDAEGLVGFPKLLGCETTHAGTIAASATPRRKRMTRRLAKVLHAARMATRAPR